MVKRAKSIPAKGMFSRFLSNRPDEIIKFMYRSACIQPLD